MNIKDRVFELLKTIKLFINRDGGDVNFVDLTNENVLILKISGACVGCISVSHTFDEGVKKILMDEIPELKDVQFIL